MTKKPKFLAWNDEELRAAMESYWARDWKKALMNYRRNPKDFYAAWYFLHEHPANQVRIPMTEDRPALGPDSYFWRNLRTDIMRVDPKTKKMDHKKPKRNTRTEVWLEWGPWSFNHTEAFGPEGGPSHDYRVDTGAKTYERAIVNLAHNVWMLYKDQTDVPNTAKLKKKDRW